MSERDYVIFNGLLTLKSEVKISPFHSGLYYGDGCFETFRAYSGKFLHLQQHLHRLKQAMKYLHMPERDVKPELIVELIRRKDLIDKNALVRIQVWREGKRAYKLRDEDEVHLAVECELYEPKADPLKVITSQVRTMPSRKGSLDFKLSSSQAYMLAAHDAQFSSADAGLMLNQQGFVSEADIGNIFWIRDGSLFTPSEACDFIPGITRGIVMELHEVCEGEYEPAELMKADAAFITNSMMEIRPISRIDDLDFITDMPLLEEVISSFQKYRNEHLQ
jgi:branched-subunit amino acid aminotransferase/4-amino-4-deoxychorismate lyase